MIAQSTSLYGPACLLTEVEQIAAQDGLAVSVSCVPRPEHHSIFEAVDRLLAHRVAGINLRGGHPFGFLVSENATVVMLTCCLR